MIIFFLTASLSVIIDQMTKMLVRNTMDLYESIVVIRNFFSITYIENNGISFGMFGYPGNDVKRWILVGIIFVAITAISAYWFIYRKKSFLYNLSCGMILGGALGNFIDRLFRGRVTDFLEFGINEKTFPVFNGADTFISIGVGLFIIYVLTEKDTEAQGHRDTNGSENEPETINQKPKTPEGGAGGSHAS